MYANLPFLRNFNVRGNQLGYSVAPIPNDLAKLTAIEYLCAASTLLVLFYSVLSACPDVFSCILKCLGAYATYVAVLCCTIADRMVHGTRCSIPGIDCVWYCIVETVVGFGANSACVSMCQTVHM